MSKCAEGCTCGHHSRRDFKKCEPGCTCARHEQTEEHRRKNSEANKGRKMPPEAVARRTETKRARGDFSPERMAVAQEGRRRALAQGLITTGRYVDGRSRHPSYERWYNMVQRCTNPEDASWNRYGARGIKVCNEWLDPLVFYHYLDTVLGPCPEKYSIDRIDNDGDYEPGNIRWATAREQVLNRRNSRT